MKQELKNAYEKISTGTELRAGLIEIKNLLKEEEKQERTGISAGRRFQGPDPLSFRWRSQGAEKRGTGSRSHGK